MADSGLKHNPFSALRQAPVAAGAPAQAPPPPAPAARAPLGVVVVRRPAPADLSQAGEPGGTHRAQIRRGLRVAVVLKADQDSGTLTEGVVQDILTSSPVHPRGIKVRLESGQVGRVRRVFAR